MEGRYKRRNGGREVGREGGREGGEKEEGKREVNISSTALCAYDMA